MKQRVGISSGFPAVRVLASPFIVMSGDTVKV